MVIGDFNSHSTSWGYYNTTDNNGKTVEQWADSCDLTLIHDDILPKSFNSARWKKGFNPDLEASRTCVRSQSWTLSRTPSHGTTNYTFQATFNCMKADWNGYSAELDKFIENVEPIPANYKCFVESVCMASRRHIPRGCRTEYVPGLTDESKSL